MTYDYPRKADPNAVWASYVDGSPSLYGRVYASFPNDPFVLTGRYDITSFTFERELTAAEKATLDAEYDAWFNEPIPPPA